ncbi:MAG: RidA family protein [Planctomycetota bacterium]
MRMTAFRDSRDLRVVLPEQWRRPSGFSQGVLASSERQLLFVAGQIGCDATNTLVGCTLILQFEAALRNCVAVVVAAGGTARDLARLTMYCVDRNDYLASRHELGLAYRRVMGHHYPAMSLVEVKALLEPGALIEIEATASIAVVPRSLPSPPHGEP